jgi:hypothetical protein
MITRRHLIGACASAALAMVAVFRGGRAARRGSGTGGRIATPGRAASRSTGERIVTPKLQISGVFSAGTTALDPKDYYTPGNESPAVSTADYYHMHACQFLRPYDLDAMGSAGAAVKAANGNNRYVWFMAAEHPGGGGGIWRDSMGFKIGFSDDPGVLPPVAIEIIPGNNQFAGGPTIPGTTGYSMRSDMAPSSLVYNPDDASYPFYLYTQGFPLTGSLGTQSIMWKSSNMFDWVGGAWGPKNIDDLSMAAGVALTAQSASLTCRYHAITGSRASAYLGRLMKA